MKRSICHVRPTFTFSRWVLVVLILTGLNACVKEYDFENFEPPEWNPNVAAPIGVAKLSFNDILDEFDSLSFITIDNDNFITVFYRSTIYSEYAENRISLDDQSVDTTMVLLHPAALPVGDSISQFYSFRQQFLSANNDELDSARLKGGDFNMTINTDLDHDVRVILRSSRITKSKVQFEKSIFIPASTFSQAVNIDMSGYDIYFYHEPGQKNLIPFNVEVRFFGDANPNIGPYNISIDIDETDMFYSKLFGSFNTRTLSLLADTIKMPLFKNSIDGTIYLNDPRLNIYISNSFGIPVSLFFDPLSAHSSENAPYDVMIHGPGLSNPLTINAPNYSQVGQTLETNVLLDKTNSTINDAINILPEEIRYGVEGTLNPGGATPQNFVLDTSRFKVEVEVEMPLELYANNFTINDTIDFEVDTEDVDMVEWFIFKIDAESTLPVAAEVQAYFVDSNNVVLDSLFQGITEIIPAATPGPPPMYKAVDPTYRTIAVTKNASEINKIGDTRKVILSARLNTAGGGNQIVRFYSDNYLQMKFRVQAKLNVKP